MRFVAIAFTLVLFVVALGLALSNTQPTDLKFFLTGDETLLRVPLVILLLGFFLIGVAVGMLTGLPSWLLQKRDNRRLRKQLRKLEQRIADDQAVPAPMPEPTGFDQAEPELRRLENIQRATARLSQR